MNRGYLSVLLAHLWEDPPKRGAIKHVEVRHDDDCGIWNQRHCDCGPDIETGKRIDRKYVHDRI